jgi:hypothetical protein
MESAHIPALLAEGKWEVEFHVKGTGAWSRLCEIAV